MNKPMAVLWSWIYVIPLIILSTACFGVVSFVISLFDRTPPRQLRVARAWARSLLWIAGVKVTVEGLDRLRPGGRNYVFVSNHVSYMDIPVVLGNIPEQFLFLAKSGLFKIPFLGTHLKTAGHVSVPQEDPRSSIKTLQRTAALLHDGRSTLVFPEGGRSETGELQEFKDGTLPILDVTNALRADQWLENHPGTDDTFGRAIKRQMRDAFYTDTEEWKRAVVEQAIDAAQQALVGLNAR